MYYSVVLFFFFFGLKGYVSCFVTYLFPFILFPLPTPTSNSLMCNLLCNCLYCSCKMCIFILCAHIIHLRKWCQVLCISFCILLLHAIYATLCIFSLLSLTAPWSYRIGLTIQCYKKCFTVEWIDLERLQVSNLCLSNLWCELGQVLP